MRRFIITVLTFCFLVCLPSSASSFRSGLPAGDQLRVTSVTAVGTGDTTIANLTTTSGLSHGIVLHVSNTAGFTLDALKITVDGAAERTLYSTGFFSAYGTVDGWDYVFPLPIRFKDSLTVKLSADNASRCDASLMYSVF